MENIKFNNTNYEISASVLASAKDSLKTHLSTVINGTGVNIDPITYDGEFDGRVYVHSGDGAIIYVKVSDSVLTADDLIGATFAMNDGTTIVVTDDNMTSASYGVTIPGAAVSVANAAEMAENMYTEFAEEGLYFVYYYPTYPVSLTFPGCSIVTLDGTDYGVDPTKISTATTSFIAHLDTIAGDGMKVVVGGVEYGVDSTKVASAITALETAFGELA